MVPSVHARSWASPSTTSPAGGGAHRALDWAAPYEAEGGAAAAAGVIENPNPSSAGSSLSAQQRLTGVAVQADVHAEVLVRGVVRHEAVQRPEQEGAGVLSVRVLGKERAVWVIRHTLHKQSQSTRPRQLASIRVEAPVAFDIVVEGTNASMHGLPRRTLDACV